MNTLLRRKGGGAGGHRGGGSASRPAGAVAVVVVFLLVAAWSFSDASNSDTVVDSSPYVPPPTAPRGRRYRGQPTPAAKASHGAAKGSDNKHQQRALEEEEEERAAASPPVSFEEEALARAPPEHQAWCRWNNRHNRDPSDDAFSAGTDDTVCFGRAWSGGGPPGAMLRLVVTARASDLMANASASVEWLKDVPFPVTLYVKADLEGVEEDAANAGAAGAGDDEGGVAPKTVDDGGDVVARELGVAYRRLPGFRERLERLPPFPAATNASAVSGMTVADMASALQRHYAHAWGAVGVDYGSATATARRKTMLRTAGTAVRKFLRRLKSWRADMASEGRTGNAADAEVVVHVQPNVGDEAAAITSHIARVTGMGGEDDAHTYRLETVDRPHRSHRHEQQQQQQPAPQFTAFVHAHRESWHSIDVVEQLKCMCLSPSKRRYVSLSSPSRAFMFQCAPLRQASASPNRDTAAMGASPAAQEAAVMAHRTALIADATQMNHADAFGLLVGGAEVPEVIARDCCASFVLSASALRAAAGLTDFGRMQRMLLAQPLSHSAAAALREANAADASDPDDPAEVNRARDAAAAGDEAAAGAPAQRVWEELSMYAERVWRHVFRPSLHDIARDLAAVGCGKQTPPLKRAKLQRLVKECSVAGGSKSHGRPDREVGGIETCPAGSERNRYQLQ